MNWLLETTSGIRALGPEPGGTVIAIIPGDDVALHHLWLNNTSPARRLDEARGQIIDLASQPIEDLHIAIGPANSEGKSWVAVISHENMHAHLSLFAASGHTPVHMVPAALLLQEGGVATLEDLLLFRTDDNAGATEPALAEHLVAGAIDKAQPFHPAIGDDTPLPIDLMQGPFAPTRRWWRERPFQLCVGGLAVLALLLALAPGLIHARQERRAVQAFDAGTRQLASRFLGSSTPEDAASAAVALAKARRRAEGAAIGARLTFIAHELEQVPEAHLTGVSMEGEQLRVVLGGPANAINTVLPRLAAGPFTVERLGTDILMADRRSTLVEGGPPVALARQQLVAAGNDAAILNALRNKPALHSIADLVRETRAILLKAGFNDAVIGETGSGVTVTIPAARARALLPALADLEAAGARFTALSVQPLGNQTLSASFGATP